MGKQEIPLLELLLILVQCNLSKACFTRLLASKELSIAMQIMILQRSAVALSLVNYFLYAAENHCLLRIPMFYKSILTKPSGDKTWLNLPRHFVMSRCHFYFVQVSILICSLIVTPLVLSAEENLSTCLNSNKWIAFRLGRRQSIYLVGIAHTMISDMVTLPVDLEKLIARSEYVYFESDYSSPEVLERSVLNNVSGKASDRMFSNRRTERIKNVLWRSVSYHNTDINQVKDRLNDIGVTLMLEAALLELSPNPKDAFPLEFRLVKLARDFQKTLGGLENSDSVFDSLKKIPVDIRLAYVDKMLEDSSCWECLVSNKKKIVNLSDAVRCADIESSYANITEPKVSMPEAEYFKYLITARNGVMSNSIKQVLEENKPSVIFIGASHLGGLNGVIKNLEESRVIIDAVR